MVKKHAFLQLGVSQTKKKRKGIKKSERIDSILFGKSIILLDWIERNTYHENKRERRVILFVWERRDTGKIYRRRWKTVSVGCLFSGDFWGILKPLKSQFAEEYFTGIFNHKLKILLLSYEGILRETNPCFKECEHLTLAKLSLKIKIRCISPEYLKCNYFFLTN